VSLMFTQISGLRIYPPHNWPQVEDGVETVRYNAHPIIRWLSKRLPIRPYVDAEYIKYKDGDAIVDNIRGAVFCSHRQYDYLKQELCK